MLINADFSRMAIVMPQQYEWVASPQAGVERVMLDRIGEEKARATSIVRYAPSSRFSQHSHPGGEEILVLSGTFSDEKGHYPAGWYLRNPPASSHQPSSFEGTTIFVKLGQMSPQETQHVRINTHDTSSWQHQNGREVCPLFANDTEQVCLRRLAQGEVLSADGAGGTELLVVAGAVDFRNQTYEQGSWIRLPASDSQEITASTHGATLYIKSGHLAVMRAGT